jgi:hypothetical protein
LGAARVVLVVLDIGEQQSRSVAVAEGAPRNGAKLAILVHLGADLVKFTLPPQMRNPAAQITKLHALLLPRAGRKFGAQ